MNVIDKSQWPEGEWTTEADLVSFTTEHGFDGVIVRHFSLGHLCGYVGVSKEHPLYGKSYGDAYDLMHVDVHGGLTYSGQGTADYGKKPECWYFGFDCAHLGDLSPGMLRYGSHAEDSYRDIDYVKRHVAKLSMQLAVARDVAGEPV